MPKSSAITASEAPRLISGLSAIGLYLSLRGERRLGVRLVPGGAAGVGGVARPHQRRVLRLGLQAAEVRERAVGRERARRGGPVVTALLQLHRVAGRAGDRVPGDLGAVGVDR